jgi:hypothetical protein
MHRAAFSCPTRVRMEVGRVAVVERLNQAERAERNHAGMGTPPPSPRDFIAYCQDSWKRARAALAPAESRPLGRRSRCVPAELYPPPRWGQDSKTEVRLDALPIRCATKLGKSAMAS